MKWVLPGPRTVVMRQWNGKRSVKQCEEEQGIMRGRVQDFVDGENARFSRERVESVSDGEEI